LSLRSFSNYVKLYIFNENSYLDDLIANIRSLETPIEEQTEPAETKMETE
jgi:hypothetical protein